MSKYKEMAGKMSAKIMGSKYGKSVYYKSNYKVKKKSSRKFLPLFCCVKTKL